jgi:D-alanyl-D-alanine carboxypeptidase
MSTIASPSHARRHRAARVGSIAVAGLLVVVAACGSDENDASPTTTAAAATSTAAASSTTTATTSAPSTTRAPSTTNASSTTSAPAGTTAPPTTAAGGSTCVTNLDGTLAAAKKEASLAPLPADLVSKLDAAATSSFPLAAAPGAIVGVQTPQGTWTASYGDADPTTSDPMEVGMYTRIGSVTKTFTGTVIMQLAEQGKLSLDDPISKYVPDVPNGDRIPLRMLANMTSGVASYTRSTAFTDVLFSKPETAWTPEQVLQIGLDGSPVFEPGARFDYSNTNTVLLGMVIEKVTGKPVEDVFREQIFEPLKLQGTSWPAGSTEIPTPHPQGYTLQGNAATPDNPSNATNWNPSWGWTAGELISRMDDLLVYGRALGTGRGLLSEASQTERLRSFPGAAGYGIAAGCASGWVGHTGELPGFNTSVFYDTTSDTTIIVQVNSDIASGDCVDKPTLVDDPGQAVCSSPATRMFVALSTALGNPFPAPPG